MKNGLKLAALLAIFGCAAPMYAEERSTRTLTKKEVGLLLQQIQAEKRQYEEEEIIYVAQQEIKTLAKAIIGVPLMFMGDMGLIASVGLASEAPVGACLLGALSLFLIVDACS